jgi:hypothetical protein
MRMRLSWECRVSFLYPTYSSLENLHESSGSLAMNAAAWREWYAFTAACPQNVLAGKSENGDGARFSGKRLMKEIQISGSVPIFPFQRSSEEMAPRYLAVLSAAIPSPFFSFPGLDLPGYLS